MKKVFCSNLKTARGAKTQTEVARLLGINHQNWQRYESGGAEPNLEMLHRICALLGVSSDWLLGLTALNEQPMAYKVAESSGCSGGYNCPECAKKELVIADQAAAVRALAEVASGQKKNVYTRARSCSPSETPA